MPSFIDTLARAKQFLNKPAIDAEMNGAQNIMRDMVECLEQARPTQTDFIELPKDHVFTPDQAEARKRWALEFIPKFAGVARALGYGVFQGGTLVRDIDMVAIPWRQQLSQETTDLFVLELCRSLPLMMGNRGTTIYGHRWYALWDMNHRDHQIDLKVILPAATSLGSE